VETTIDKVDLPAAKAENEFKKAGNEYTARASMTVACGKGSHNKRFYIVPKAQAGKRGITPGSDFNPVAYVDVQLLVTEPGTCQLKLELKAYLLEFVPRYDFTHGGQLPNGARDELPIVEHKGPKAGRTRNIAKLIEEDGKKVDNPFAPKAP
jgi:hypothetical protein